jgi:hypothetical protein
MGELQTKYGRLHLQLLLETLALGVGESFAIARVQLLGLLPSVHKVQKRGRLEGGSVAGCRLEGKGSGSFE